MYEFRIYPTGKQRHRLFTQFDLCSKLYNNLLGDARTAYKETGKADTRKFTLINAIKTAKGKDPNLSQVYSQSLQNVGDRLSKAYANFFRRIKERKAGKNIKAGFPRFKKHFRSITYPQSGFSFKSDNRLFCSKIGNIPIVLHRVPKGKIKTLTIKRNQAGQWFATFACEVNIKAVRNKGKAVGIDVGLENFATLSDGVVIENPKFLRKSEDRVKLLQRRVSRKVKGSKNRRKAKHRLAKLHLKVTNQRKDFCHKLSHRLVTEYSKINVEKLGIKNMLRNHHLAKSISDASWNDFIQKLSYKALSAGSVVVEVNPRGTSQRCSNCGEIVKKSLRIRQHTCPTCGLSIHRDLNAALNICASSTVGLTGT